MNMNPAQERCIGLTGFPEYATTPGTELCLLPQLIELCKCVALEGEQEILMDLGINEGMAHPQYSEGYDDGLRAAARALVRLFEAEE